VSRDGDGGSGDGFVIDEQPKKENGVDVKRCGDRQCCCHQYRQFVSARKRSEGYGEMGQWRRGSG